jgi:CBS domain-containing protein
MGLLARDVMQRYVGIIDAGASLEELERAFDEAGVGGFPVVECGCVVGVVSRTDVMHHLGAKSGKEPRLSSFYADLPSFDEHLGESFADAAARGGKAMEQLRVSDLMTASVVTVAPDAPLLDVACALTEHQIHRVLVTDDTTLVGIVSSLDIVRLVAQERLGPIQTRPLGVPREE